MKKTMIAISVAVMSICAFTVASVNEAQATENTVEMQGAGDGDGHCTKCGLKNGNYRCPAFSPISGARPTDCKCGHSKNSHAYRR